MSKSVEKNVAKPKEFAVIKFPDDNTYSTCSRKHQLITIGENVTIKWSKREVFKGIVVFAHGKLSLYFSQQLLLMYLVGSSALRLA